MQRILQNKKDKRIALMMRKGQQKMERSLDIRRIVKNDDDLHLVLPLIMDPGQQWLFKHHHKRFLTTKSDSESDTTPVQMSKAMLTLKHMIDQPVVNHLDKLLIKNLIL